MSVAGAGSAVANSNSTNIISQIKVVCLFVWWCLTPLSTIFQLHRGGQIKQTQANMLCIFASN
jgi:hypothetical protein